MPANEMRISDWPEARAASWYLEFFGLYWPQSREVYEKAWDIMNGKENDG